MKSGETASVVGRATVPWGCWDPDATLELTSLSASRCRSTACVTVPHCRPPASPKRCAGRSTRGRYVSWRPAPAPQSSPWTTSRDRRRSPTVLPLILSELEGIASENIKILVALGAHRPMVRTELERKLGVAIVDEFDIEQHHPYENLIDLGRSSRGTPIWLNRSFCEAELKISVGGVMPHPYMGFSGGAKLVVPGLAGIDTLQANHQPAVTGISGGLANPDVDARQDVEEIALKAGLDFTCNVVVNSRREIAGLFCGHPVTAHRAAARFATDIYATAAPDAPYDVVCLNAYPKDGELLQVGNALNCYRTSRGPLLKRDGTLVITACCQLGTRLPFAARPWHAVAQGANS